MNMATPMYRQDEIRSIKKLAFYLGLTTGIVSGAAIAMWIAIAVGAV